MSDLPAQPRRAPRTSVTEWTSIEVGGRRYNATLGIEAEVGSDDQWFVAVIYTGRRAPLYVRAESLSGFRDAVAGATALLLALESNDPAELLASQ